MDSGKLARGRFEAVFEDSNTALRVRITENGLLELFEDTDGPGLYIVVNPEEFIATLQTLIKQAGA